MPSSWTVSGTRVGTPGALRGHSVGIPAAIPAGTSSGHFQPDCSAALAAALTCFASYVHLDEARDHSPRQPAWPLGFRSLTSCSPSPWGLSFISSRQYACGTWMPVARASLISSSFVKKVEHPMTNPASLYENSLKYSSSVSYPFAFQRSRWRACIARSSALAVGGAAAGSLKRRRSTRCTGQPESIPNASAKVPPLSASYEPCSRPVGKGAP